MDRLLLYHYSYKSCLTYDDYYGRFCFIFFFIFLYPYSAENEYKLLLWWTRVLELSLRQADMGGPLVEVKHKLVGFTQALWLLGEDKASAGLLGAIGLGRRSQLSLW